MTGERARQGPAPRLFRHDFFLILLLYFIPLRRARTSISNVSAGNTISSTGVGPSTLMPSFKYRLFITLCYDKIHLILEVFFSCMYTCTKRFFP